MNPEEENPMILDRATRKAMAMAEIEKHVDEIVGAAIQEGLTPEEFDNLVDEWMNEWHARYDQEIERGKKRLKDAGVKIADPGIGPQQSQS